MSAYALEVNGLRWQVLERIVVERIHLIGRREVGHLEKSKAERMFEAEIGIPFVDRGRLENSASRQGGHFLPKEPLCVPRSLAAAGGQAVGEHDRINSAGARCADAFETEPPFLEQTIKHAPG